MEIKKGFKAFNKGLKCQDFQFEENTEYEIKEEPILCERGFHYCENPLDTLNYYDLCDSEFAEIEDSGNTKSDATKSVTNKIKIKAKLDLSGFIKASFDFLWKKCYSSQLAASGYYSKLAASGDYSKLAASGDSSKLAASGYSSQLAASGENSVCAAIGPNSIVKGIIGTWITLAEYDNKGKVICVKSAQIDGKKLKADTYYKLEDKKFKECK
ncbi:MAG: hypothetical protein GX451_02625 [Acholeplasmataceae bacterium]|nr:hypothetical protein [Acholeplasmataceae bacterium]